jgi:Uma2 family endonuclease
MGAMPATERMTADEFLAKMSAYELAGLRELWLVDTAASDVLVFRRSEAGAPGFDVALELERDETLTSPQLDGFALPLVDLFPE